MLWYAVLCGYAFLSCALLALVIGDPDDDSSRLGAFVRWFYDLPERLLRSRVVNKLLGETGAGRLRRAKHYLVDEPNPVLQALYIVLVAGGYGVMIKVGYPRVPCSTLAAWHKWTGMGCFACTLGSFCLASRVEPGYIVDESSALRHDNYPYDQVLFMPGRVCPTTGTRKIARSKFCSLRQRCVARFDHFCPWVNASIGEENYRFFLLFLMLNVCLLTYGAYSSAALLLDVVYTNQLWDAVFIENTTGRTINSTPYIVIRYLVGREKALTALFVVCFVMALLVAMFFAFHLWLLAKGYTTNEHYKWRAIARECRRANRAIPTNLYNRGFFANLAEALWPLSARRPERRPAPSAWQSPLPLASDVTPSVAATKGDGAVADALKAPPTLRRRGGTPHD